jgi:uncharacterized protein YdhG (YjbR/CyaY superfamily)
MSEASTVMSYISKFPEEVQSRLNTIRDLIKKAVPDSDEKISYGVPTATLNGKYLSTLPVIKIISVFILLLLRLKRNCQKR